MKQKTISILSAIVVLVALCKPCPSETLDGLGSEQLEKYCRSELEWGAPSLPVASRLLYREALEELSKGDRERAAEKLRLSASLSGDYAAPLFTLARIELFSGKPEFFSHLSEALRRNPTSFPASAVVVLNTAATSIIAISILLLVLLVVLLLKYWQSIEHTISESRWRNAKIRNARSILIVAAISLVLARLGIALYIALLAAALWQFMERKEKTIICAMLILLAGISAISPLSNYLAPAIDPGSTVRRLSLVNERSVNAYRLSKIKTVDENRYRAERDFAIGTMMYRLGLYDEARVHLLESVSIDTHFAPGFINLGNVYFMQGDYDRALAGYRNAVEVDSTNAVAHYNIGQAYIKKLLFAQSSIWLQRANALGIERYRASHPALEIKKAVVYEQGSPGEKLWRLAKEEGRERRGTILGEMLQGILLFQLHRLWILLAASLAAGVIISRRVPKERRVLGCENCGLPTCNECMQLLHSIKLCPECAGAIEDVSSTKVAEVLLRTRRQKIFDVRKNNPLHRFPFLPGSTHILSGKIFTGFFIAAIFSCSLSVLAMKASYIENDYSANMPNPGWQPLLAWLLIVASYGISFSSKIVQEPRSYRIIPSEKRRQTSEQTEKQLKAEDAWLFLESAPPASLKKPAEEEKRIKEPTPARPTPSDVPPDPFVGNILDVSASSRRQQIRPQKGTKEIRAKAQPERTKIETEDNLLAEIKKGSSWR